jgi:hypothetical protein
MGSPAAVGVVGRLPKISGFQLDGARASGYAAGRLSQGCGAAAFIPQNAHGK